MANKWTATWRVIALTFALAILVFLSQKGGRELFFSIIFGYYGELLIALIVLYYYKSGWWSFFLLLVVATASLGRAIYNNPDVVGVFMKERFLHTALLYITAALSLDYYRIFTVPQITLIDGKLFLNFGKTAIDWQDITEIRLNQGYLEVKKRKKKIFFSIRENVDSIKDQPGLITQLTTHCFERDIPFKLTPINGNL
ncbi:MAG: hypothetical protein WBA22_14850 [Candidatus Methanofastidiosia archaeon]